MTIKIRRSTVEFILEGLTLLFVVGVMVFLYDVLSFLLHP